MSLSDVAMMELAEAHSANNDALGAEKLHVMFSLYPVKDELATEKEGRPVYVDAEFIQIIVPGDKNNVVKRPVREKDKRIFRKQYEAFKAGTQDVTNGTPLKEWPGITRSEVEMLAYFKVQTVEALADLSDGAIQEIGPIRHLTERAKRYVADAKAAAPTEQMAAALKAKDLEMENLRRQMKELTERVEKQGRK